MPSYVVEINQSGGCDYTIECGTQVVSLQARLHADALTEIEEMIAVRYNYPEGRIATATLYEVSASSDVNVSGIYARIAAKEKEERDQETKERELAELARLQKKHGVKG